MEIRRATIDDLDAIMPIFDEARGFMRRNGNLGQWTGGYPSREQIADDKDKIDLDSSLMLKDALNKLKEKERFIIFKRYFEGITQMELSEEIGISQAQISRIEKNCLDNMKKMMK